MDAGGARFLRDAGDELFDVFARNHHHVRQFVDDDDDVRQRFQVRRGVGEADEQGGIDQRVGDAFAARFGFVDDFVEFVQFAHFERDHQFVAPLHFIDRPAQRVFRVAHVGNDWRQQVRDVAVHGEFDSFRVNQNQLEFVGFRLVEHAGEDDVDAHRFAGAGGTGDE